MMWETEASIEVQAPVADVYEYLADLRRHQEWSVGVAEIEQASGDAIAVGAEFRAREVVPAKFTSYSRITQLDPPRRVEWHAWDGRMFRVDWAFEISPAGPGRSRVVLRARFHPASFLGRVVGFVMRREQNVPRENAESLRRLRAAIESKSNGGVSLAPS